MPRKTDGIEFELNPGPQKDEEGKPLLYARLSSKKKLSFKQLDHYSVEHHHTMKGELEGCFTKFLNAAALWFHEGYRIETPIGSFAPKVKLMGEHTSPKTVTGRDVKYNGVEFIPSKEFIDHVCSNKLGFRLSPGAVGNSQMHDPQVMEEALRICLSEGVISIRKFGYYSQLKRDSAQAFLDSLTQGDHPRLIRRNAGRSYVYIPVTKDPTDKK